MSQEHCRGCNEFNSLNRRQFLAWSSLAGVAAAASPAWLPRVSFARDFISGRDVVVAIYLRGGCDGLSMVCPFGDPAYYTSRPTLAVQPPDASTNPAVNLDGYFGLSPAMGALLEPYLAGKLAVVQATGSTDSSRSHFDAQRYMEVGKPGDSSLITGWLGRHLITANQADPAAVVRAIGVASQLQTSLVGGPKTLPIPDMTNYGLSGPSGTRTTRLNYLAARYAEIADPLRASALNTQATVAVLAGIGFSTYAPAGGATYSTSGFQRALKSTAALIKADVGVEAVAIDRSGWDTHSAQGVFTGDMAGAMSDLANGLLAFYRDVISQGLNVTVVVMSEFGRRVVENASQGTDHGHGNMMMVMGNHIHGGRVVTIWPTLSNLYQNFDLQVTIDFRDILAEIVSTRLGNGGGLASIFPGYTPTFRGITN